MQISDRAIERLRYSVIALRGAKHESFGRALSKVSAALQHDELRLLTQKLSENIDAEKWVEDGVRGMGSMVGSARLSWPKEREQELGHVIALVHHFAAHQDEIIDFTYKFYYVENHFDMNLSKFVEAVIVPFFDEFLQYLEDENLIAPAVAEAPAMSVIMNNPIGVAIQNATSNSTQSINVSISFDDARISLDTFRNALNLEPLSTSARAEVEAEISTLRAQLSKSKPSVSIIGEAGRTLRSLTEGVAAGMMTPAAVAASGLLWAALGLG